MSRPRSGYPDNPATSPHTYSHSFSHSQPAAASATSAAAVTYSSAAEPHSTLSSTLFVANIQPHHQRQYGHSFDSTQAVPTSTSYGEQAFLNPQYVQNLKHRYSTSDPTPMLTGGQTVTSSAYASSAASSTAITPPQPTQGTPYSSYATTESSDDGLLPLPLPPPVMEDELIAMSSGKASARHDMRYQPMTSSTSATLTASAPARSTRASRAGTLKQLQVQRPRIRLDVIEWYNPQLSPQRNPGSSPATASTQTSAQLPPNEYLVLADLPGMQKSDIQLHIADDMLSISGVRHLEMDDVEGHGSVIYRRAERGTGEFKRLLKIPSYVNPHLLDVDYTNGVLRVSMPISGEPAPRLAC